LNRSSSPGGKIRSCADAIPAVIASPATPAQSETFIGSSSPERPLDAAFSMRSPVALG
jgi:hypothetical protein